MRRLDVPTARELLTDLLMRVGLKSPGLATGLDLDFDGISVDDGARLVLPPGYLNHIKRQHPHWFNQRRKQYSNPDKLRRVLHPDFQKHIAESSS